jgi:predicted nucleotidyltransferase
MFQSKGRCPLKPIDTIPITAKQHEALREIKHRLLEKFDIKAFVLYGSVARGQADEESDVDLLVVTSQPLTRFERHEITNVVFEVNLQYDTNFSTLVVDHKSWETGIISVLPVRDEIIRDGIQV